jgi:hypothetical protein
MQSVPESRPGEVYSMQYYVLKFASDLRQVGSSPVFSINKTDRRDITEILLKEALNTITKQFEIKSVKDDPYFFKNHIQLTQPHSKEILNRLF